MATERKAATPDLHPTETHLWFRSKDLLAPGAISGYAHDCRVSAHGLASGADLIAECESIEEARSLLVAEAERMRGFANSVDRVVAEMIRWQSEHPERVGLPD